MPHGGPDFDTTAGSRTTYRWSDLDELAVRLGSIVSYDRRGDLLFLDSFEDGYHKWLPGGTGLGSNVTLSRASARSGAYSLRCTPGAGSGGSVMLQRIWGYPVASAFGLELSATLHANLQQISMAIFVYTGSLAWQVYGRYYHTTGEWQIYIPPNNWVTIATLANPMVDSRGYHTFKLVGDPSSGKYVRAILNAQAIDLSAYAMTSPVSFVSPQLFVDLKVIPIPFNYATVYLDDVIVTQNEPT